MFRSALSTSAALTASALAQSRQVSTLLDPVATPRRHRPVLNLGTPVTEVPATTVASAPRRRSSSKKPPVGTVSPTSLRPLYSQIATAEAKKHGRLDVSEDKHGNWVTTHGPDSTTHSSHQVSSDGNSRSYVSVSYSNDCIPKPAKKGGRKGKLEREQQFPTPPKSPAATLSDMMSDTYSIFDKDPFFADPWSGFADPLSSASRTKRVLEESRDFWYNLHGNHHGAAHHSTLGTSSAQHRVPTTAAIHKAEPPAAQSSMNVDYPEAEVISETPLTPAAEPAASVAPVAKSKGKQGGKKKAAAAASVSKKKAPAKKRGAKK